MKGERALKGHGFSRAVQDGYDKAAQIAHTAHVDHSSLREAALKLAFLSLRIRPTDEAGKDDSPVEHQLPSHVSHERALKGHGFSRAVQDGYDKAAQIAHTAHVDHSSLREAALKLKFISLGIRPTDEAGQR